MDIIEILSGELKISKGQIESTIKLIDEGNTIPFIARYRKEATGGLDDTTLRELSDRLSYLRNLKDRKEEVQRLIEEGGNLTEEITAKLRDAKTITEVDDIYRPFRPKKRTRATIAKEKGLEPLAEIIISQSFNFSLKEKAKEFIDLDKGVESADEAINLASDIIAETISDNAEYRKRIRNLTFINGKIQTKCSEENPTYKMYYDHIEYVKNILGHRILAVNRGEKEGALSVKVIAPEDKIEAFLEKDIIKREGEETPILKNAIKDSYSRLIAPSIEREIRSELKEKAEEGAIKVFSKNLKALLMQSPVKGKVVMGFDPGFRTGCKIAVVDETGKVLDTGVAYVTDGSGERKRQESKVMLKKMLIDNKVEIISLGNGTASRESEIIISDMIREIEKEEGLKLHYVVVSEAGASVYSASSLAAKEFPDMDVSLRGAVSIGRRLQDPLAELVKIDPKSIGVGQYQHDVTQKRLDEALGGVVEDCVNKVGVDLNTASAQLLSHIAGINASIAKNIVEYREETGKFIKRKDLLKVKRLGDKAFKQCAGFLRISESNDFLDNTSVHPESYDASRKIIDVLGYTDDEKKNHEFTDIDERAKKYGIRKILEETGLGEMTLEDILKEIKKPGRDVRESLEGPVFMSNILEMKDLKPGMILKGTVRNVADFGAFVDIGVHQDGLIHISQLSNKLVKHPLDIVKVSDVVDVKVVEIDLERKRIALSMRDLA
ncbi:Tex family protein [Clostridium cylindrosporum]|uniref:Transcriptional accessory protein n=1 Tax=Clostridium cylindrosporum DSM 605 TaxID=1121307 RepID=A0A0J8DBW8_CLOCY|nr:Tex family protein [Clostridium cylindrosporum]KMT23362.1 transcriptional accessory protein [Clostridium cylindrosporum DSM 605]